MKSPLVENSVDSDKLSNWIALEKLALLLIVSTNEFALFIIFGLRKDY